jgi:aryl-alcohol dehydrogenase-like predicted oxidoreductase
MSGTASEGRFPPRPLGRSGIKVAPVGLGCWQFSKGQGTFGGYWLVLDDAEIRRILADARPT